MSRIWVTSGGKEIPVEEMTDSHLLNSFAFAVRCNKNNIPPLFRTQIINCLAEEISERGIVIQGTQAAKGFVLVNENPLYFDEEYIDVSNSMSCLPKYIKLHITV